ncbi:MAG: hypothetical protein AAFO99_16155 [Bacteroidota bacterium]
MKKFMRSTQNWLWVIVVTCFALSCSSDKDEDTEQAVLSQAEIEQILDTDELSGVADGIVTDLFMNSSNGLTNRTETDCFTADYQETGFTVTFDGCTVEGIENVSGTLAVTYMSDENNLSFTITFTDFMVEGVQLNGTRSFSFNGLVEDSAFGFTVSSDMSLVLEDGSVITETGNKTFGFIFGDTLEDSLLTIDGNWTVGLGNDTYAVAVSTTLEGNLSCEHLVAGLMQIGKNGLAVSVDFGDGTCDDIATIIYPDGTREDFSLAD